MSSKMLLTGQPKAGKTTLFQKFIHERYDDCIGFYAQEIRENDVRVGFEVITVNLPVSGGIIAHVDFNTPQSVGKYKVDLTRLDIVAQAAEQAMDVSKILIIDEIGQMQSYSDTFRAFVENALDSDNRILATIKMDPHPWTDDIKSRFPLTTTIVTPENRDALPAQLRHYFR